MTATTAPQLSKEQIEVIEQTTKRILSNLLIDCCYYELNFEEINKELIERGLQPLDEETFHEDFPDFGLMWDVKVTAE